MRDNSPLDQRHPRKIHGACDLPMLSFGEPRWEGISFCSCGENSEMSDMDRIRARVEALEAALTLIASMAGTPDAAEGCRNIMKTAVKALGEKE